MEDKIKSVGPFWPAKESTSGTTDATTSETANTTNTSTSSDQTATTQSTNNQTATTQASWVSLGSKTYNVNVELPSCGIKATDASFTLLKNGSATTSTTFYTTDTLGVRMTYTVAPSKTNCAGMGSVKLQVTVDGGTPKSNSKGYSELTSSKSDSIEVSIGKLSAGSHTIKVEGFYLSGNVV